VGVVDPDLLNGVYKPFKDRLKNWPNRQFKRFEPLPVFLLQLFVSKNAGAVPIK